MEMTIRKQIGKNAYTFIVSGKNLHEVIMESQKLSFEDVDKCGCCESNDLYLNARVAGEKKFEYTEIKCAKCKSQVVFGQTMENSNVFYLRKIKEGDKKGQLDWKCYEEGNQ